MASMEEAQKSRVLVIGGTGHIGKHLVFASIHLGHSTAVLVRDTTSSDPAKAQLLKRFIDFGAALLKGDLFDHESLVKAIKSADVVISAVGSRQVKEQTRIITAIKEAGNVKRFLPSEFGSDVDHINTVDPAKSLYAVKANLRRLIEAQGIPHTYVVCNSFTETYLPSIGDVTAVGSGPPANKIIVLGDGSTKAVFMVEEDIATYTMRAVDDARTLNKILHVRSPANMLSHNELISLWEKRPAERCSECTSQKRRSSTGSKRRRFLSTYCSPLRSPSSSEATRPTSTSIRPSAWRPPSCTLTSTTQPSKTSFPAFFSSDIDCRTINRAYMDVWCHIWTLVEKEVVTKPNNCLFRTI